MTTVVNPIANIKDQNYDLNFSNIKYTPENPQPNPMILLKTIVNTYIAPAKADKYLNQNF